VQAVEQSCTLEVIDYKRLHLYLAGLHSRTRNFCLNGYIIVFPHNFLFWYLFMTHFGILARLGVITIPCVYSDKELQRRGHRITLLEFRHSTESNEVGIELMDTWRQEFPVGILDENIKLRK